MTTPGSESNQKYRYEIIPLEGRVTKKMREAAELHASKCLGMFEPPAFGYTKDFAMLRTDRIDLRKAMPSVLPTRDAANFVAEAKKKKLFQLYMDGKLDDTDVIYMVRFLDAHDYTDPRSLRRDLRQLRADAEAIGDAKFCEFLRIACSHFRGYLTSDRRSPRARATRPLALMIHARKAESDPLEEI